MKARWERIVAVLLLLLLPVIVSWLYKVIYIGPFHRLPLFGMLEYHPEAKALTLLGILLIGIVLIIRVMKN